MSNTFLKILVLGGVGYLIYKYYYLPHENINNINTNTNNDIDNSKYDEIDGKTTFYGDSKKDFIRGFPLPKSINEINENVIYVLSKPKQYVFGQNPRGMFKVKLFKDSNTLTYESPDKKVFVVNYDDIRDKLVMNKDYTK
jgi:hypothetical protein